MSKPLTLAILALFLSAAAGCDGPRTVWSGESRSPDGKMIAHAWTVQTSGIGTGNAGTFVDLNWTSGSQRPTLVLAFADGSDSAEGDKKVGMNWFSSTHLNLTYTRPRTIDFQAIKCHGIDISVQDEKLTR